MSRKQRTEGVNVARLATNPEEKRFADAWSRMNDTPGRTATLAHLLHVGDQGIHYHPTLPTKREAEVAATVVQWLGSPVGRAFLEELGYYREVRIDKERLMGLAAEFGSAGEDMRRLSNVFVAKSKALTRETLTETERRRMVADAERKAGR